MRTEQGWMDECGAALKFFDGFGENWGALNECHCYLDAWLPAERYVLVVSDADQVLAEEPPEVLEVLFRDLVIVGDSWSRPIADGDRYDRPARPFHLLFLLPGNRISTYAARFRLGAARVTAGVSIHETSEWGRLSGD